MSGNGFARYCKECRKQVLDVSKLSPLETKRLAFRVAAGERVCGRLTSFQNGTLAVASVDTGGNSSRVGDVLLSAALAAALPIAAAAAQNRGAERQSSPREPSGIITGRVLQPDGARVTSGLVFLYAEATSQPVYVLDEIGRFEISAPPGNYMLLLQTGPDQAEKITDVSIHSGVQSFGDVRTQSGRADLTKDTQMHTTLGELVSVVRWSWKDKLRHPVLFARSLARRSS